MAGRIVSIKAENFMTYDYVEFFPGPNLNVVIGPNGTGKSSLVCAMVLGLKSRPHILGRGTGAASFVRGQRGSATIEVELLKPRGSNYVIKRVINADSGNSTWFLNGVPSPVKDVENLVTELNIQVDNLCQFLPQDRVQDFARMNQQDLLENTIKCVGKTQEYVAKRLGKQQLLDDWKQLKELRERDKGRHEEMKTLLENIRMKESQNQSIETDVKSLRKKKTLEKQLLSLKQKHAWLVYSEKKSTLDKASVRLCELEKDRCACEKSCAPIRKKQEKVMLQMKVLQKKYDRENVLAEQKVHSVRETCKNLSKAEDRIEDARQEMEGKLQMEDERQKKLSKLQSYVVELTSQLETARRELGTVDYGAQVKELSRRNMCKIEEKKLLQQQEEKIRSTLHTQTYEAKALENERNRMLDVKNQRLQLLRRKHPDVITAVEWLRENQHRFLHPVYEPMMTLINPNDDECAKYLENIVPERDLVAFMFEDGSDMSTFLLEMRDGKGLNVNAVQSDGQPRKFEPSKPLSAISSYGFKSYASSLYTTVPAVHNYLCQNYNLHNIPIGNEKTYQILDNIPSNIRFFFALDKRINRKSSRYSSHISTLVVSLGEARLLTISADMSKLADIEKGLAAVNAEVTKLSKARESVQQKLSDIEAGQEQLLSQKKELEVQMSKLSGLEAKIRMTEDMCRQLSKHAQDTQRIRAAFQESFKTVLAEMNQQYGQLKSAQELAQDCWVASKLTQLEMECLRTHTTHIENLLRDKQRDLLRVQELREQTLRDLEGVKADVKAALTEAKRLTDGLTPQSEGFAVFRETFQGLPDEARGLEAEIETIRGKLDCLAGADNGVLAEFENRKKQIAELKAQLEAKLDNSEEVKKSISEIKQDWLVSLNELVEKISRKFSACFATLKCAGEVKLHTGANEDDFEQYGLRVRVKFRSEDELQDLNKHLQSGGERSVSTAIFMISLQGLTRVPFCCVDEINQGMDKFNERMIFDLLVATTSVPNSPQYFLLTPKLLSGLQYSPTTFVSCVFNGRWITPRVVTSDHGEYLKKKKARLS